MREKLFHPTDDAIEIHEIVRELGVHIVITLFEEVTHVPCFAYQPSC